MRNARGSRDTQPDGRHPELFRRSSSTTPKTVKIDERFLQTSKESKITSPMIPNSRKNEPYYFTQFTNLNSTNQVNGSYAHSVQGHSELLFSNSQGHATHCVHGLPPTSTLHLSPAHQSNMLRQLLREKLQNEKIDLTKPPYSDEVS